MKLCKSINEGYACANTNVHFLLVHVVIPFECILKSFPMNLIHSWDSFLKLKYWPNIAHSQLNHWMDGCLPWKIQGTHSVQIWHYVATLTLLLQHFFRLIPQFQYPLFKSKTWVLLLQWRNVEIPFDIFQKAFISVSISFSSLLKPIN